MAASRGKLITILVIAGFVVFLAYTTLTAQRATCDVCMEFGGLRNCATASGSDEAEALNSARTTACGPLAAGMDQSIACGRTPPATSQCRTR